MPMTKQTQLYHTAQNLAEHGPMHSVFGSQSAGISCQFSCILGESA